MPDFKDGPVTTQAASLVQTPCSQNMLRFQCDSLPNDIILCRLPVSLGFVNILFKCDAMKTPVYVEKLFCTLGCNVLLK